MAELSISQQGFIHCTEAAVEDHYELIGKIAEGDFSVVLKGRHKKSGQIVAVKVILKAKVRNLVQLEAEIGIMKVMDHPHIARLFSVYSDAKTISLILEFCEGPNLFEFLLSKGSVYESDARNLFRQILYSIYHMHSKHICHRDIKPENYLFTIPRDTRSLKLVDLGFSKVTSRAGQVMRTRVGSPFYVAPEVLKGTYGLECDMWSAGVILYVLLCGEPPFTGKSESVVLAKVRKGLYTYSRVWDSVSPQAKDLIDHLLIVDPTQRLTAEQALGHPWMADSDSGVQLTLNCDALLQYSSASRLKKAVLFSIARHCSERDIEDLKASFERLDTNGDGVISFEEFRNGVSTLSNAQITDLWADIDLDQSGSIDYTEFLAATMDRALYCQQEKLWASFVEFDRGGTGKITADELMRVLGQEQGSMHDQEYWSRLVREADTNGDGFIDFANFMHMMDVRKSEEIEEGRKHRSS